MKRLFTSSHAAFHRQWKELAVSKTVTLAEIDPVAQALLLVACVAYISQVCFAIITQRHLYGDSVWFFVKTIAEQNINPYSLDLKNNLAVSRYLGDAYLLYPVLLSVKLGITSLHLLSYIYGVSLYAHRFLSLLVCYWYTPDKRLILFPLASLFAGSINIDGIMISESHLLVSCFWAILFLVLFAQRITFKTGLLLALFALPTLLTYESMLVFGPALAAISFARCWYSRSSIQQVVVWGGNALWCILGAALAAYAVIHPRDASNRAGFLAGFAYVFSGEHTGARVSCFVFGIVVVSIACLWRGRQVPNALILASALASLLIPASIVLHPETTILSQQLIVRNLNLTMPLICGILLVLTWAATDDLPKNGYSKLFAAVCILGICQSAWQVIASNLWSNMLALVRAEVNTESGVIPWTASVASRWRVAGMPVRGMNLDWPIPSLCLLLAESGTVQAIIVPTDVPFQPFDPYIATDLPHLRPFGVTYDKYIAALGAKNVYHLGSSVGFGPKGSAMRYMTGGWAFGETWGTWTSGPEAHLQFDLDAGVTSDLELQAVVSGFVNEKQPALSATVVANGERIATWDFQYGKDKWGVETRKALVPRRVLEKQRPFDIAFIPVPCRSPAELGISDDHRKIALAFTTVSLRPASGPSEHR